MARGRTSAALVSTSLCWAPRHAKASKPHACPTECHSALMHGRAGSLNYIEKLGSNGSFLRFMASKHLPSLSMSTSISFDSNWISESRNSCIVPYCTYVQNWLPACSDLSTCLFIYVSVSISMNLLICRSIKSYTLAIYLSAELFPPRYNLSKYPAQPVNPWYILYSISQPAVSRRSIRLVRSFSVWTMIQPTRGWPHPQTWRAPGTYELIS